MQECTIRSYKRVRNGFDRRWSKGCKWISQVHGGSQARIGIAISDILPRSERDWIQSETARMRRRGIECSLCVCRLPIDLSDTTIRRTTLRYWMSSRRCIMPHLLAPHHLFSLYRAGSSILLVETGNTASSTEIRTSGTYRPSSLAISLWTSEWFGRISRSWRRRFRIRT
jgi:hypothetical protein